MAMSERFLHHLLTILLISLATFPATTSARVTAVSKEQISCTMCDSCDNPCQPVLSPPPPSPPPPSPPPPESACPPPPALPPPESACPPPPALPPPPPVQPECPPPPSCDLCGTDLPPPVPSFPGGSGGSPGSGVYGAAPPPPNPILPYFPYYYYYPPPDSYSSGHCRKIHPLVSFGFILVYFHVIFTPFYRN